jgi:hypothetical protein
MLYYFERHSVFGAADDQMLIAETPEEAVGKLKEKYGRDLEVVYDENFEVHYEDMS